VYAPSLLSPESKKSDASRTRAAISVKFSSATFRRLMEAEALKLRLAADEDVFIAELLYVGLKIKN
jgi:hypothetical protein